MIKKDEGLSIHRLEALIDGIYAFAMTLLVLNFILPHSLKGIGSRELAGFLVSKLDSLMNYFLSFALLAIFWLINQQLFHHIKKTDAKHIWLNILTLMFVVFIPFSTSIISACPDIAIGEFIFALNIFLVSVLTQLSWLYANHKRRLIKDETDEEHLKKRMYMGWIGPAVSALAMVFAFINPVVCSYLYLLIPAIIYLPNFRKS